MSIARTQGIESRGHRSRSRSWVRLMRSVRLRSMAIFSTIRCNLYIVIVATFVCLAVLISIRGLCMTATVRRRNLYQESERQDDSGADR